MFRKKVWVYLLVSTVIALSTAMAEGGADLPADAKKIAVADHVVTNNGNLEATRRQVAEVHALLVSQFASQESK